MSKFRIPKSIAAMSFGSTYIIPDGMTVKEFKKLKAKWDEKLQKSGHPEIERLHADSGLTLPFLYSPDNYNSPSGSSYTAASLYNEHTAEYYRLCRVFLAHADFKSLFPRKSVVYKYIWTWHTEGYTYRHIAKLMNTTAIPKYYRTYRREFWSHWHIEQIRQAMFKWHREHEEGLLRPSVAAEDL